MKSRVDIHGTLEFPLTIGCAAFIRPTNGKPIRTSSVKHFISLPSGVTYIETKNTHYVLHPPAKAVAKGHGHEATQGKQG